MADSDKSVYNLRYNQITSNLEGFGGGTPQWTNLTLNNVDPTQVPVTRQINTTAPLLGGGNLTADRTLSIPQATSSADGFLLAADWTTFNSKLTSILASANIFVGNGSNVAVGVPLSGDAALSNTGALTFNTVNGNVGTFMNSTITVNAKGLITAASSGSIGNLTDVGTDGIIITGGIGAVLGSGTSIAQHVADATHNGYLSSADWSRFNSDTAGITNLTGDVTATGPGSAAATLATVNGNVGSFNYANITVNAKGLITAASANATPVTSITGTANQVIASASTGPVTLSLPQSINNTADVTFDTVRATSQGVIGNAVGRGFIGLFTSANIPNIELIYASSGFGYQINAVDNPTGTNRTYTLQDMGADGGFVYTVGTQSIGGSKTFTNNVIAPSATLTSATNQIAFHSANQTILSVTQAATTNRTVTLPDPGGNDTLALLAKNQTFSGVETFSNEIDITAAANVQNSGLINTTGASGVLAIQSTSLGLRYQNGGSSLTVIGSPTTTHTYTLPELGTDASFVMSAGTQTVTGSKTFSASTALSGGITLGNTTSPSATTLDYYQEGSWTPTDQSGAGLTLTNNGSLYTRIGRMVWVQMFVSYPATASGTQIKIGGLPFTVSSSEYRGLVVTSSTSGQNSMRFLAGTTNMEMEAMSGRAPIANSSVSGAQVFVTGFYSV